MKIDGNVIHYLCSELNAELTGARVDKIHNPGREEYIFHLHTRTEKRMLLICLSPGRARANIITRAPENPPQPGMFCMLLRKHLQNAVLTGVRQPDFERILFFDFIGTSEIGQRVTRTLCAEFTGRRTNLLLLGEKGVIIDCLRRSDVTQGGRLLLPGAHYELPPNNGYAPPEVSQPPSAESWSAMLEASFNENDGAARKRQQAGALLKLLDSRMARLARKLDAQRLELARAENREHLRIAAELILANRVLLEREARGCAMYRLENYYDDGKVLTVPVNPALGPAANAQKYYKDYRKAKTAAGLLGDFIAQGEQELQYLESVADFLHRAQSTAEIEALRAELETQGYCKPANTKAKRRKVPQAPPLEYRSSEGVRILVGRGNLQNDQLSLKIAKANDLWFHTQNCPGSHVILCVEGRAPGEQSIREAAMLAAWHSRARGPAEVDFTPAKALKKPQGAPPGKVVYHTHRSVYAHPTEELVSALKKNP